MAHPGLNHVVLRSHLLRCRALKRYHVAVAEYRQRVEAGGHPYELERLHVSVVAPALEECERLDAPSLDEEKRLVEQLRLCHEECVAASYELRHPLKSISTEEYRLSEKAEAPEATAVRFGLL
jgi:hypothetical protein